MAHATPSNERATTEESHCSLQYGAEIWVAERFKITPYVANLGLMAV
jgi:hypothetical protein